MQRPNKFFRVTILTTAAGTSERYRYTDNAEQLGRIMDVPGYSHITERRPVHGRGWCADAVVRGTHQRDLQRQVKAALGGAFDPKLNVVRRRTQPARA